MRGLQKLPLLIPCPARSNGQGRRILLAISELRRGGAERVVVSLAVQFQETANLARVLCIRNAGSLAEEARSAGVEIDSLNSVRGYDAFAVWKIVRRFKAFRPDIINVHDRSTLPYVVLANWLSLRRPVVFSAHGLLSQDMQSRLRDRWASRWVSAVTAVSQSAAEEYARLLGWRKEVAVIDNGVSSIKRTEVLRRDTRRCLGLSDTSHIYLAVGNIKPEKGFEDLLEAAAILRSQVNGSEFTVLIAGAVSDTEYHARLVAQHRDSKLSGTVRFLGPCSDMPALYSAADAFVLSSRKEGLPMVLLEAMSAGLPTVATSVGAVPQVIRSTNEGLLIPPSAPAEIARGMLSLMRDRALRERIGPAGKARVEGDYSVRQMAEKYMDVYTRVLAR